MKDKISLDNIRYFPYVEIINDKVTGASNGFLDFTGYCIENLIGKTIEEIYELLRIKKCNYKNFESCEECFLFTKSYNVRRVEIIFEKEIDESKQFVVFLEKPGMRFEDQFSIIEELYSDNSVGVAIFGIPDITLLKANQKYLDFLDKPFNNINNSLGKSIGDIVTGWHGSTSEKIWDDILEKGKPYHIDEYRYDKFERGTTFWNATLAPVYEENKLKWVIEITTDITEQVLNREKIEEQAKTIFKNKEKLEAVIENMSDALFIIDKNYRYINMNKSAREFFPGTNINKVGDIYKCSEFYDLDGNKISFEDMPLCQVIKGHSIKQKTLAMTFKDKCTYIGVSGTPIFDEEGNFSMGIICARDITEHVRYDEFIRDQRDNFHNIIDTLDLPMIRLYYPTLNFIQANQKAHEYLKDIINNEEEYKDLINSNSNVNKIISLMNWNEASDGLAELHRTKSTVHIKNFNIKRKGKNTYVNIVYQPIFDMSGKIVEVLVILSDVTSEIEKMEKLEQVLSMQEEFFSFISHEFKTPLTVIFSAIQAMELICKNEMSDRAKKYLSKIRQSSLQQMRLVNNLLDITRADMGYLKMNKKNSDIVYMTKVIIESVYLFAKQKEIDIKFSSTIRYKIIAMDDEKYERILLNLLSNAIKFTPRGKVIYVKIFTKGDNVCIQVKDEGVGVPKEKHKAIFEKFGQINSELTRMQEGTGIGLCLVKLLVNALNGVIELDSKEGEGSTFTVALPIYVINENEEIMEMEGLLNDTRLIQARNIEFSNIYLD